MLQRVRSCRDNLINAAGSIGLAGKAIVYPGDKAGVIKPLCVAVQIFCGRVEAAQLSAARAGVLAEPAFSYS